MTSAALRGAPCVFAAMLSVTADSPWPVVGETLTHDASLEAVQLHSRAALTVTFTLPPDAGTAAGGAAIEVWHRTAAGPASSLMLVEPHAVAREARMRRIVPWM